MKVFRTRRANTIMKTTVVRTRVPQAPKPRTKPAVLRASIIPTGRADLTKREWQEYGELIRGIKRTAPDYQGLNLMTLNELRDAYESTKRCDSFRAVAMYA